MDTTENKRAFLYTTIQWILLGLAIVFSIHTHRWALYRVEMPHVFVGFRAALLFLYDLPLIALVLFAIYRLLSSPQYRESISDILNKVLSLRYGGIWWILLIIWMGVGTFWANQPTLTRYGTLHTAILLFTAFIIAQVVRQREEEPLLWLFCIGAIFQTLIAIGQIIHGDALGLGWLGEIQWDPENLFGYEETMFRGYGLTPHPNILAGYLIIALFAVGTLLQRYSLSSLRGSLAAAAFGLIAVGVVVTLSRTGLLAGLIALAVVGILKRRELTGWLSPRNTVVIIVIAAMGATAAIVLIGDMLIERNSGLQDLDGVKNRLTIGFDDTIEVIEEAPALGVGENNLMVEVGSNNAIPDKLVLLPAHNVFLVVWAELGVVGLILFLLICGNILVRITSSQSREVLIWTLAFLAWFVIMFLDYYPWLDYRTRLITLWIMGMWWGYNLRSDHEVVSSEAH